MLRAVSAAFDFGPGTSRSFAGMTLAVASRCGVIGRVAAGNGASPTLRGEHGHFYAGNRQLLCIVVRRGDNNPCVNRLTERWRFKVQNMIDQGDEQREKRCAQAQLGMTES